jgi:hypothetical protein
MILGIASLAVGLFVMAPIASHSNADDSASSGDTIVLVLFGLTVAVASAGLCAGEALRWRARSRRAGRADGFPQPR